MARTVFADHELDMSVLATPEGSDYFSRELGTVDGSELLLRTNGIPATVFARLSDVVDQQHSGPVGPGDATREHPEETAYLVPVVGGKLLVGNGLCDAIEDHESGGMGRQDTV